jgi:acetyltransferase-like isoleucine patch superfamily enzyme
MVVIYAVRRAAKRAAGRFWLAAFRRRRPNAAIAGDITLNGLPVFIVGRNGVLKIEAGVIFTSSLRFNMVGLFKRCSVYVADGAELTIGAGCGFSAVSIHCVNRIAIGEHVTCGGNVAIWDNDFHPLDPAARRDGDVSEIASAPICIEDDVFVGANSIVLKGVTIGRAAIVGAGSVVTRNVPPGEVWAGNPASCIRPAG